jgi:hypothetical protein
VSIAFRCEVPLRCAFIVWDGDVTPDQWIAHLEKRVNDPAYWSCTRVLIDLTTIRSHEDITDDVIREMAARWRGHAPQAGHLSWAIVPNGAWNRARKVEEELETFPGIHTMLFNHTETACIWLGVDLAQSRRVLADVRDQLRADER